MSTLLIDSISLTLDEMMQGIQYVKDKFEYQQIISGERISVKSVESKESSLREKEGAKVQPLCVSFVLVLR